MLGLLKRPKPVEQPEVRDEAQEKLDLLSAYIKAGWPDETVPTLLVKEGKIQEVYYTTFTWQVKENGYETNYTLTPITTTHEITADGDRFIFETSLGCYEYIGQFYKGESITFNPGDGGYSSFRPCVRKAGF